MGKGCGDDEFFDLKHVMLGLGLQPIGHMKA